ncbi:G5 domain-containing protein, partial [Peptoniphilus timonensis]|uniref:G5 domain-containing protein n=1 Tax=Peptoniphilus timonensis TaxID=1268254 RepID=UPI00155ABD55
MGDDKRSKISGFAIGELIFKKINPRFEHKYKEAITLKDITKINEDGSYNIPFAELVIKQNGEEIKRIKYNVSGKLKVSSGSSFSELYKITHEDREEVVEIPIEEERVADDNMLKGKEKVIQEGEAGSKKIIYDVQFVDGKENSKIEKSSEIIKPMKPRIIHYGTAEKS